MYYITTKTRGKRRQPNFHEVAQELGIPEDEYVNSQQLREWAERHRNEQYVPERLLKAWGLEVDQREI